MKWNTTTLLSYAEELSDREVSQLLNKAAAMIDSSKYANDYAVASFKAHGVKHYYITSKKCQSIVDLHFKRSINPIFFPRSKRALLKNIIIADSSNSSSVGIVSIMRKLLAKKLKEEQNSKHHRYPYFLF